MKESMNEKPQQFTFDHIKGPMLLVRMDDDILTLIYKIDKNNLLPHESIHHYNENKQ